MRKILAVALIGSLLLLPSAAVAGDPHAVRNRWEGVSIGAGSAIVGGLLLNMLRGASPAYTAPPAASAPPAVLYSPPPVVEYRTWVPGHWEDRWVPVTEKQRVWVDGHYENGWWVPGHWQDRVRNRGYWTRAWVEGYWR